MHLENNELLNKIIEIQSCIIQGRDLDVLLYKNKSFLLEHSHASAITICLNAQGKVHPEFIMEEHRVLAHLLHAHVFHEKTLSWDKFIHNHYLNLMSNKKYFQTDDIYELFKGILSKKTADEFNKKLKLENAILMPLTNYDNKELIGYVCFVFQNKDSVNIQNLEDMKILFQILLQPLYDKQYNIIYNKCVRVDENFSLLTDQEKRITKYVLQGKSYKDIATILNISINTLKTHMKNIFNKYLVNSKIELYNKLNAHIQ